MIGTMRYVVFLLVDAKMVPSAATIEAAAATVATADAAHSQ